LQHLEIRLLTPADAAAYWHFRLEALETEPDAFGASPEEHRATTIAGAAERLGSDPANNFVVGAFVEDRLVGTAGFYRDRSIKERHKGHVWGVYVTAAMRGSGLGRGIMNALLEHASRVEGIEQIVLLVTTSQTAAAALYQSLGFRSFGRESRALKIGQRYVDEEHMVLYLTSTGA
jgi:RimJ/RimL family protein N-acetyltransferase